MLPLPPKADRHTDAGVFYRNHVDLREICFFPEVRITEKQRNIIENTAFRHFGSEVRVYLFGSRARDDKKGGDIDLLLEQVSDDDASTTKKISFLTDLKKSLGDRKIDVILKSPSTPDTEFLRIVDRTKIPL